MRAVQVTTVAAVLVLAAVQAGAEPFPAPISQASEGKAACYYPNRAAKTCHRMASYERNATGEILYRTVMMLAPRPVMTFTTTRKVTIRNGQVCGLISESEFKTAEVAVNGASASPGVADRMREAMENANKDAFDQEMCTTYAPDGDGFVVNATIDGVPRPIPERVIWVSPSDGYSVGP